MNSKLLQLTDSEKQEIASDVLNHATEVLWYFFSANETGLDDEASINQFVEYLWGIAVAAMASAGMEVIGRDEEGRNVLAFTPVENVSDFISKQIDD